MEKILEILKNAVIYGYNLSINASLAQKDVINYNFDTITEPEIKKLATELSSLMSADLRKEQLVKLINDFIDTPMGTNVDNFVDEYLQSRPDSKAVTDNTETKPKWIY